jgi:uncharacterized protein
MLPETKRERLNQTLKAFQDSASVQIAIVTVSNLGGLSIERFANELFNQWGIGQKSSNNGVLILVAREERQMRIEVGYGAEALPPDALCGQIIEEVLKPNFRENKYYEGLNEASNLIRARLRGEFAWQPGDGQYLGELAYQALPKPAWYFPLWFAGLGAFFLYLPYYRSRKSVAKTINPKQTKKGKKQKAKKDQSQGQIPNPEFYPSLLKNFLLLSLPGIALLLLLPQISSSRFFWMAIMATNISFSFDRIHYELRWFKGWTVVNWLTLIFFRSWFIMLVVIIFAFIAILPVVLLEDLISEQLSDFLTEIIVCIATLSYAYLLWMDPKEFHHKFMKGYSGSGSYSSGGYSSYSSSSSSSSSSWSSSSSSSSWGGGSSGGGGASGSW